MKDKLSIVIVNYNSGNYLLSCLKSIEVNKGELDLDIWVVDSSSDDESFELAKKHFPNLNYISNKENVGFTKANNQALRKIENEYILILNPDTEVFSDTLSYMLNFLKQNENIGATTCKVELANNKLDWSSHRGFPTPLASFFYYFLRNDKYYHLSDLNMSKTHEVDAVTGAFLLTRKSVLDKVGLFDEDYFMYGEDLDLCFRIKQAGYKIVFVPDVKIIHYKGVSSGIKGHSQQLTKANIESKTLAFNSFYKTMKIFYKKNLSSRYPFFINWIVYLGIDLKWILARRKLHV
ncbi:MAG: glycosyltransferase family 2 protein [Candidatus Daviesbacteria bacterium]|nr:glycosyltransferase family 2 protein [Candidatus Daviesbacteria bacterium]